MCDPKSHHRCINKGILCRNNMNSGAIPPDRFDGWDGLIMTYNPYGLAYI